MGILAVVEDGGCGCDGTLMNRDDEAVADRIDVGRMRLKVLIVETPGRGHVGRGWKQNWGLCPPAYSGQGLGCSMLLGITQLSRPCCCFCWDARRYSGRDSRCRVLYNRDSELLNCF